MFLIIIKLFYWQVLQSDFLSAAADKQHLDETKVEALRGNLYFSDGSILASSKPSFILYGLPKILSNEEKNNVATRLANILTDNIQDELSLKSKLLSDLSQDLFWVQLKKGIDLEVKKNIDRANLLGIGFNQTSTRFYPEGSSSAHLLGFVGSSAKGDDTGYFGLEGAYDGELRGISGVRVREKDAFGIPILIGKFLGNFARDGKNLTLNVDRIIQFIAEKHIREGIQRYGAKSGSVVIMDPYSGAILALASYPNYNPLNFSQFPKEYYKNPIVADLYEPGSTFKILVMAAALNEEVVKPDSICDICGGPISLSGFTIRTWNSKYYPNPTMEEVIVHSDNTGMVYVAKKLGLDKFYSYLENFGIDTTTNIDLQDETSPLLRPKNEWREIDLATASFGQGLAITPIQMVTAVSAIANGGYLMEPQVVKNVSSEDSIYQIKPKLVKQVLKEETAKKVTEMMVKAVDEGEAKFAKPKGFKIAGKTGTAQIPVAGHYDKDKTIASFVGFAPADHPKFVMLVRYDQPSASIFGAETAAPTFFEIAKDLFVYFKIAPEQ